MNIGERLEEFATKEYGGISGLNKEVNKLSGKRTSIYKYVHNERTPGASILIPLIKLNCNINWLLTGEGPMLISDLSNQHITKNEKIYQIKKHLVKIQHILDNYKSEQYNTESQD